MDPRTVLLSFLYFHLAGFALFIGTFIVDGIVHARFWKLYERNKADAMSVLRVVGRFPRLMGMGFGVIILSGIGMMSIVHDVVGGQTWFRVKIGLVVIILILQLVGRKQGVHLRREAEIDGAALSEGMKRLKRNMFSYTIIQYILFATIVILSVFKFQ